MIYRPYDSRSGTISGYPVIRPTTADLDSAPAGNRAPVTAITLAAAGEFVLVSLKRTPQGLKNDSGDRITYV